MSNNYLMAALAATFIVAGCGSSAARDFQKVSPLPLASTVEATNAMKVIESVPEGVDRVYSTDWMVLMYGYIIDNTGVATHVRTTDDGKLYFNDLFSIQQPYWVEASTDSDGNVTIPTHQEIGVDETYGMLTVEVSKFAFGDGYMYSDILRDVDSYQMVTRGDGSIVSADLGEEDWTERYYLVLADAEDGVHALIGSIVMSPVNEPEVEAPALADADYSYSYLTTEGTQEGAVIKGVADGDDLYLQGLCPALPEKWLKGTFNADRSQFSIPSGQYLGSDVYVHYFSAAHLETVATEEGEASEWVLDDALVMDVADNGATLTFTPGSYFAVTIAGDVAYSVSEGRVALHRTEIAKPAKPVISGLEWIEVDALFFKQPTLDVDGNVLDSNNLTWRLYFDDQLYTFDPSLYMNLSAPMTEMPYMFDDGWDFYPHYEEQVVVIYEYGYQNIGVESVYTVNGESRVSDRAYWGTVAIDAVGANSNEVVETIYTDLTGRRIDNPSNGIYIVTKRYADGSVKSHKVLR